LIPFIVGAAISTAVVTIQAVIANGALGLLNLLGPLGSFLYNGLAYGWGSAIQGAFISAMSAVLSYATYGMFAGLETWVQVIGTAAVQGVIGGVTSVMQGGNFGNGFLSSAVSSLAGSAAGAVGAKFGPTAGFVAKVVAGGTTSEITGGKFANGAISSAFSAVVSAAAGDAGADYGDEQTEKGIEPTGVSGTVTANPDLADNIRPSMTWGCKFLGFSCGPRPATYITGTAAPGANTTEADFAAMLASANSVNGEWSPGNRSRVFVEITRSTPGAQADWIFQTSADGRNFVAVLGVSGAANPININVGRLATNVDRYTVFHEVLHTFGLAHQLNKTRSVMSYAHSKIGSHRNILTSDVQRLCSAYHC
jgi:hypothetical protein